MLIQRTKQEALADLRRQLEELPLTHPRRGRDRPDGGHTRGRDGARSQPAAQKEI
jgi:hypothetical protein